MKKATLLLVLSVLFSGAATAQEKLQKQIDSQYLNSQHKAFMHQVSPEMKRADEWIRSQFEAEIKRSKNSVRPKMVLSTDTSWGYSEAKAAFDSVYRAQTFSQRYYEGDTTDFVYYNNQYTWHPDSMRWKPSRLQSSYYSEGGYGDSTVTWYYQFNSEEPYLGQKFSAPKEPSEGADEETIWEYWDPTNGWASGSKTLYWSDDNGWDTLRKSFYLDIETQEYVLEWIQRNFYDEEYYGNEYENYINGELYSWQFQVQTPEYMRREYKYYLEGELNGWTHEYTLIDEDGRYIYSVSKVYDNETMELVGTDSLHFTYKEDDTLTEAMGYRWDSEKGEWVLVQAYNSYQHYHEGKEQFVSDSVVVFRVEFDEETMENVITRVEIKSELDYDEFGNQIEVRNYSIIDDTLRLANRTVREFREINGYFAQTRQETWALNYVTKEIYLGGVSENIYTSEGAIVVRKNFSFTAEGDTTYGYVEQTETLGDGATARVTFNWDYALKELILKNFYVYSRRITGGEGNAFNQTTNSSFDNMGNITSNRSMSGYNGHPGVFNDGPIPIEMGDTLSFYVSGMSQDMTIPEIEVSDMPSTASFDPETRKFYWIVDEENPAPMMYKAIRGEKYVTAEVEFLTEEFTVSAEEESSPEQFELMQNYPNPFNPSTNISFRIPSSGEVSLRVYNLLGQEVATLVNGRMNSGMHSVKFDASKLASGVYIYRIEAGNFSQTKKMMLIK